MTNKKSNDEYQIFPPNEPVLITRKELIQIFGRSSVYVDQFIKKNEDFPEKVSQGCYRRKDVMNWLKEKGFI